MVILSVRRRSFVRVTLHRPHCRISYSLCVRSCFMSLRPFQMNSTCPYLYLVTGLCRRQQIRRAACARCQAVRQIHIKYGTIHRHGPRNNPCPGSDLPSLAAAAAPATAQPVPCSQPGRNLPPRQLRRVAQPHPVHILITPANFVLPLIHTIRLPLAKRLWHTSHPIFES